MARRTTKTASGTDRKNGTGCLIWLVMLLFTLILFVVSWDDIKRTLESTGFVEAVSSSGAAGEEAVPAAPTTGDGSLEPAREPTKVTSPEKPAEAPAVVAVSEPRKTTPAETAPAATQAQPKTTDPVKAVPKIVQTPTTSPMEQVKATRMAVLYLVRVDDDGVISRHEVKRTVGASDSPMTDALDALMAGPNTDELNRGFISLIPSEARLLSAQVRGSTAYLNFNEAFMYNRYGIEGYAGQLKQIVYTATGFPNVKDVQILIEGQKRDYLGGDGVYIGKPLSRASF